jgi:hypothetical protein
MTEAKKDDKSYMNAFGSNKMGRVWIAIESINKDTAVAQAIMAQMLPIHSTYIPERESVVYLAISDHFDMLDPNEDIIPIYLAQVHSDGSITFARQGYKKRVKESTREQIVHAMVDNNVNMDDFKAWVRKTQNAKDEDFKELDDNFLEILNIYINRRVPQVKENES